MRFFQNRERNLNAIYAMHLIDGFAMSMVGIFIPIYLLVLGYTFVDICVFNIVHVSILAFAAYGVGYFSAHTGLRKILFIRFPFLFLYLVLLYVLDDYNISLLLIAAVSGIQSAFYWIPLNILFSRNASKKKIGFSIGKLFALPQMVGMIGPMLGAIISSICGFKVLFVVVFIILLLSLIPLFRNNLIKFDFNFELKKGIKFVKKYPKYFIADVFDNIGGEMEGIIWPIFVYTSLASIVSVGFVAVFLTVGSIIFTLVVGRWSDRFRKKKMMKIAGILLFGIWILRYFFDSEIVYYISSVLSGFMLALLSVPFTAIVFGSAKKEMIDEYYVLKETSSAIGRIIIFSIAILLATNLKLLFPIAGVAYLFFLFVNLDK